MNALTAYFDDFTQENPHILRAYESGKLTLDETMNLLIKKIQQKQIADECENVLKSFNYNPVTTTIKETALYYAKQYGKEAPDEIRHFFNKTY